MKTNIPTWRKAKVEMHTIATCLSWIDGKLVLTNCVPKGCPYLPVIDLEKLPKEFD